MHGKGVLLLKTQLNRVVFASYRRGEQLIVMTENAIAKEIVDAAYRIHTTLGPGLLESVYDTVLAYELNRRSLRTARQQAIPRALRIGAFA